MRKSINLRWLLPVVGVTVILGCILIAVLGGFMQNLPNENGYWINVRSPKSFLQSSFNWTRVTTRETPESVVSEYGRTESDGRTFLIPTDTELNNMNEQQLNAVYWKYINTVQVLCRNQTRLGSFKDGGKEICVDHDYLPSKPCLVYSFGSNFQFDFEMAVIGAFGCDVHTFDPSLDMAKAAKEGKVIPDKVRFQLKGLGGEDTVTSQNWHMRTLDTIMTELGHSDRILDILKIDIEGGEWAAFPHIFKMGNLRRVKQLSIEVHYGRNPSGKQYGGADSRDQLKVIRELYKEGFRIFMREHNLWSLKTLITEFNTQFASVNEISLININFKAP